MVAFKTPPLPDWITRLRLAGYRNVFDYVRAGQQPFANPAHPNLWGTETLAGDWDGRLLVVFKDFAETAFVENRSDSRPLYSHAPEFATNRNLCALLSGGGHPIDLLGQGAAECGLLYASASFLMRQSTARSAPLAREALRLSWPVLEFTLSHMPQLTDIALCGVEAFGSFQHFGGLTGDRRRAKDDRKPLRWRHLRVHCTSHTQPTALNTRRNRHEPGRRGIAIAQDDWRVILRHAFAT